MHKIGDYDYLGYRFGYYFAMFDKNKPKIYRKVCDH